MAKRKKLNTALIIAVLALVINIITASIYIYQASIMREEQHAAVWPHIEWRISYIEDEGFRFIVKNNGIGPALIKQTQMNFNGKVIPSLDSLFSSAVGTSQLPHIRGTVENRVLSPGESILMIRVEDPIWAEKLFYELSVNNDLQYQIVYESIYGQQWVSKGIEVDELDK